MASSAAPPKPWERQATKLTTSSPDSIIAPVTQSEQSEIMQQSNLGGRVPETPGTTQSATTDDTTAGLG